MAEPDFNAGNERGFYAPFPHPFYVDDVPPHLPGDAPLISLCFNEDYLPYVQGALKALASELTWRGPRSCVQSWVQAMMDLLLIEPDTGCANGGTMSIPVGTILPFAGDVAPDGFLACDGSEISRAEFAELFAVIGIIYGIGDGVDTFNIPDLRSRFPVGSGQGVGLTNRVIGSKGGEESHVLSVAELATHNHGQRLSDGTASGTRASYVYGTSTGGNYYNPSATHNGATQIMTDNQGSNSAHNNMPPFLAVPYIIYYGTI